MLLLEFLDGKGVFFLQQVLANLHFSVSVFLNFAKGMICNYYKGFVAVVSPLRSLIWMKDRDNIMKGKNKLWTQSAIVYARRRILLIRMTVIVTRTQIRFAREHTECREVLGTFSRN